MEEVIRKYKTVGHPTAFMGLHSLAKYYAGRYSKDALKKALQSVDAYTILRHAKRDKKSNPIYVWRPRALLQADLVDMTPLTKAEPKNNNNWILCIIDSYTRFAWTKALPNKNQITMTNAINEMFPKMKLPPQGGRMLTDEGMEFRARACQKAMLRFNYRLHHARSQCQGKASTVERYQRSLQDLLYRHIENTQNKHWDTTTLLPDMTRSLNHRFHRIIQCRPIDAEQLAYRDHVNQALLKYYTRYKREKPKLSEGDAVRILFHRMVFGKSYDDIWSRKLYEVCAIDTKKQLPMYEVKYKTPAGKWEKPEGKFYYHELQKVDLPSVHNMIILKERLRKRRKEYFVHWQGYDDSYDEWIDAKNVVIHYDRNREQGSSTANDSVSGNVNQVGNAVIVPPPKRKRKRRR
jgi:hypothetical protein